jgi:hypothetical protein
MWHALECKLVGIRRNFEVLVWLVFFKEKQKNTHLIQGVMW